MLARRGLAVATCVLLVAASLAGVLVSFAAPASAENDKDPASELEGEWTTTEPAIGTATMSLAKSGDLVKGEIVNGEDRDTAIVRGVPSLDAEFKLSVFFPKDWFPSDIPQGAWDAAVGKQAVTEYPGRVKSEFTVKYNAEKDVLEGKATVVKIIYDTDTKEFLRFESRDADIRFERVCEIDTLVAGFRLEAECPKKPADGLKQFTLTPPGATSGTKVEIPSFAPYALPLTDRKHVALPIVLPDLSVGAGGLSLTAYENLVDSEGVSIGTAEVRLPERYHTSALLEDVHISPSLQVDAGLLDLEVFGATIEATGVHFAPGAGLKADSVEIGLPEALGGSSATITDFAITADGSVRGTISAVRLKVGDITLEVERARITDTGFEIGSARLVLPPYLGSAVFEAKGVVYDGATGALTVEQASGRVKFSIGEKVLIEGRGTLKLGPDGAFDIEGSAHVVVPEVFDAEASLHVASIQCDPAPGPCKNAAFLQKAEVRLTLEHGIPIGQTGLEFLGLEASAESSKNPPPDSPRRDAAGNVHGITYTFGLGGTLQTVPGGGVFKGTLGGKLSTNGNFSLGFEPARIFKVINFHGGVCARFTIANDAICDRYIKKNKASFTGTGIAAEGGIDADVHFELSALGYSLGQATAHLDASVFGSFVYGNGPSYVEARVDGSISAGAKTEVISASGSGNFSAEMGRFRTPTGGRVLGVKGSLHLNFATQSTYRILNDVKFSLDKDVFIDTSGNVSQEARGFDLVDHGSPSIVIPERDGAHLRLEPVGYASQVTSATTGERPTFTVQHGERDTFVTMTSTGGSPRLTLITPSGRRAIVTIDGGTPRVATSGNTARGIYLVKDTAPGTLVLYVPKPETGRWSTSVAGGSGVQLSVHTSPSRPTLALDAHPRWATLELPTVRVSGRVHGAKSGSVTVGVTRSKCTDVQGRTVPVVPGRVLATGVPVHDGSWRYAWNTAREEPGSYTLYAMLDNGTGPLVAACRERAVTVLHPVAVPAPESVRVSGGTDGLLVRWKEKAKGTAPTGFVARWRVAGASDAEWHSFDVGRAHNLDFGALPTAPRYDVAVAAYDSTGRRSSWVTVAARGRDVHFGVDEQALDGAREALPVVELIASKRGPKETKDCQPIKGRTTRSIDVPIFYASDANITEDGVTYHATPNIAYNDAAAITGDDPNSFVKVGDVWRISDKPGKARTVNDEGDYVVYKAKSSYSTLTYSGMSVSNKCKKVSRINRQKACGRKPFVAKTPSKPGPPFLVGSNRKTGFTSCDEYPFANSTDGGDAAIIRGVKHAENSQQGRDLSDFLRRNANDIRQLDGLYQVCPVVNGRKIGNGCKRHTKKVPAP